ncbi:toprim domain-containing protein [Spiribacter sp. 390]|uniref:Toprim domain-containing protein n=1 Tax=Spiribacter pallidus TaxID=1987936 RepID=A0ABV3TE49_9GAMM
MALYQDHGGYCFSNCGYIRQSELDGSDTKTYRSRRDRKMSIWSPREINNFPLADLSHRGLSSEAVERYGIRQAVRPENGEPDEQAIFFPAGNGGGYKRKNRLTKKDTEIVGDYNGLFGQSVFSRGGRLLLITEGEEDAIALWQALKQQGKDYSVVSLPNGAGCGGIEKREVWDYITSFEAVMLAFDADEQGEQAVEKFAEIYSTEVKVKIVEMPEGCKDANDCIKQGKGQELVKACYRSKDYQPEMIIPGSEISYDMIREPIKPGYMLRSFPEFSNKMGGLRDGELGVVMAPPGVGKSTWVAEVGYELIRNTDDKVAWLFLEEDIKKATQRLVALDNDVPLAKYRLNPDIIPEEDARNSYNDLINNERTWFIDLGPSGRLSVDRLLHLLRYYRSQGVTRFIFDHISILFSHDDRDNERKLIDNVLSEVAAFCAATGSTMIMVAHIKRFDQKVYVKDDINDAQWLYIDPAMARGSGSFEQLAFWIAAIEPEKTEDERKGRMRINVKKNREWGFTGPCDVLHMDMNTGRLELSEPPEYDY